MLRTALRPLLRKQTPFHSVAAVATATRNVHSPLDTEFMNLVNTLKDKGSTVPQHVMQNSKDTQANLKACPWLADNPILMRTAERESNARTYSRRFPIAFKKAEGVHLTDIHGNVYLDGLANAGTLSLGHNHPVQVEAMRKFLDEGHPLQTLDLSSPLKDEFVTTLFSALPQNFAKNAKIQFCGPAGTDVVEAALKIVKAATGSDTMIAFHGGYHGHSNGALSLMGNNDAKVLARSPFPVQFMPYPYPYRCPFGIGNEQAEKVAAKYLETTLDDPESGVRKPGAVILEVVQGEGGAVPAPDGWLREVRRITKERGILMIVDEIQTGFGRTGKMFAHEYAGVEPDILCLSKAIGGGLPMGVVVYNKDIDAWGPGTHAGTFRGNMLAFATGTASLKFSLETKLPDSAATKGDRLFAGFNKLKDEVSIIGDVRGRGMMIGLEIVDPNGKPDAIGSLPPSPQRAADIQFECLRRGLILEKGGRHGCVMRFLPALTATEAELDDMLERFGDAVKAVNSA